MTETQLRKRMAGIMGRIPMMKLRDGRAMNAEERERFRQAWRRVASLPLDVDASSQLTLEELLDRQGRPRQ